MRILRREFPKPGDKAKLSQESDERLRENVHLAKPVFKKAQQKIPSQWKKDPRGENHRRGKENRETRRYVAWKTKELLRPMWKNILK